MVYLLGGNFAQAVQAMQTVLGTIGGMLCDGAKISCAYKLSTAAALAVQAAYLSLEGCCVLPERASSALPSSRPLPISGGSTTPA